MPGDEGQKEALSFRFAQYEEAGEVKTYVKVEAAKAPFALESARMSLPMSAKDLELRIWIALMRVDTDMQFGNISGVSEVYDRAVKVAQTTDVLLPRLDFWHLHFDDKK